MCSYLACSNKMSIANGFGAAVTFVITIEEVPNWFVHKFITGSKALDWLSCLGINAQGVNLNFLLNFSPTSLSLPRLYRFWKSSSTGSFLPSTTRSLSIFLPLLSIVSFWEPSFSQQHVKYPFIPNLVYALGNGLGWWLAITLTASIREKLSYSNIIPNLQGMGITFIITGLIALSFMVFTGINLDDSGKESTFPVIVELP